MIPFLVIYIASLQVGDVFKERVIGTDVENSPSFSLNDFIPKTCQIDTDNSVINCPANTAAGNSTSLTLAIQNLPESYIFDSVKYTCPSTSNNSNQFCYIRLSRNSSFYTRARVYPNQEYEANVGTINNGDSLSITFYSGDNEAAFGIPTVTFYAKNVSIVSYGQPILTKLKDNVYRATIEISPQDKLYINTLTLLNPHDPPKTFDSFNWPLPLSKTDVMLVPMISNATHIIGIDIYTHDFLHNWHQRQDNIGSYMEICMHPLTKFNISYLIVVKNSENYRDSVEKWHFSFPDMYNINKFGPGAWIPFYLNRSQNDFDPIKSFMGKYFWGTIHKSDAMYYDLLRFKYYELTFIHVKEIECDEHYKENIDKCTTQNCDWIRRYGVKDIDGNYYCIPNYNKIGSRAVHLWVGDMVQPIIDDLISHRSKFRYDGVGLNSMTNFRANYRFVCPLELCPYRILDDKNKDVEFENMAAAVFNMFNRLSEYAPNGFMTNAQFTYPQTTKFITSSGYELYTFTNDFTNDKFTKKNWFHRFTLGSRSISHLDNSLNYSAHEQYFSFCASLGVVPSYFRYVDTLRFWTDGNDKQTMKPVYDRWVPIFSELLSNATFYANGNGKIKTDDFDDKWSAWCKESGKCYASFLMSDANKEYKVKIAGNPKLFFKANDVTCSVNGDTVTMSSTQDLRAAIIEYTDSSNTDNGDGGNENPEISNSENADISSSDTTTTAPPEDDLNDGKSKKAAAIAVPICLIVIAIIAVVVVLMIKRNKSEAKKSDETLDVTIAV